MKNKNLDFGESTLVRILYSKTHQIMNLCHYIDEVSRDNPVEEALLLARREASLPPERRLSGRTPPPFSTVNGFMVFSADIVHGNYTDFEVGDVKQVIARGWFGALDGNTVKTEAGDCVPLKPVIGFTIGQRVN